MDADIAGRIANATDDETDFFEMSLDHLCVAGFEGDFKRVNPSWTRTLGWSREELLARPSIEFVHPDDREATLAARRAITRGTAVAGLVNRYLCKDALAAGSSGARSATASAVSSTPRHATSRSRSSVRTGCAKPESSRQSWNVS